MSNYRAFNALKLTAGQSGSLKNAWGVLKGTADASGSFFLEAKSGSLQNDVSAPYVSMSIEHLSAGNPFLCHVRNVTVTAGTVYILA